MRDPPRIAVLTEAEFSTTNTTVANGRRVHLGDIKSELVRRQLPSGGWAALALSSQEAMEPTCYSALALGPTVPGIAGRAQDFLLRAQNANGSWPTFAGDDQDGSWVTSLAAITLRDLVPAIPARLKGYDWLLRTAGKESNWLWKWKFRTADRHVRFDPDKYGWPWVPDTISWVVPTSLAVLSLKQLPCTCGGLEQVPLRIDCGVQMLLDRACPGGGWNAGNGVVYREPVAPHADDTAVALLALSNRADSPIVQAGVEYLERVAPTLTAPWSLSWTILALAGHHRPSADLQRSLLAILPDITNAEDTSTLAVTCLALDHQRALAAFGVNV